MKNEIGNVKLECSMEETSLKKCNKECAYTNKEYFVYEYISKNVNNNKEINGDKQNGDYNCCSLDIGGTLIKVVYLHDTYIPIKNNVSCENLKIKIKNDKFLFVGFFFITELEDSLNFLIKNKLLKKKINVTGGGSYKYYYYILKKIMDDEIKKLNITNQKYKLCVNKCTYSNQSLTLIVYVQLFLCTNDYNNCNDNTIVYFDQNFLNSYNNSETIKVYLLKNIYSTDNNYDKNQEKEKNCLTYDEIFLLECTRKDEMFCVMNGINHLFNINKSIVKYNIFMNVQVPLQLKTQFKPFIIANIGSGISILYCDSNRNFSRISGTAIGGGTALGLAQLILGKISFEKLTKLAIKGSSKLNLKVKDIRKDAAGSSCIDDNALATFLGSTYKALKKKKKIKKNNIDKSDNNDSTYEKQRGCTKGEEKELRQDIANSLITMVSYNIGYIVYLLSKLCNVNRIMFSGKYINNNEYIMKSLTHGVYYHFLNYNKCTMECTNNSNDYVTNNIQITNTKLKCNSWGDNKPFNKYIKRCFSSSHSCNKHMENDLMKEEEKLPEVMFFKHDGFLGAIGCFFA
ncbi:pantothenate kinase, putative [Hepatocystis sp. ex Piliocolobus tephrosceles]|nr:pantothenate kinase, putative [Hepatocystis sp. ex Piliocolobus tephrosceles]